MFHDEHKFVFAREMPGHGHEALLIFSEDWRLVCFFEFPQIGRILEKRLEDENRERTQPSSSKKSLMLFGILLARHFLQNTLRRFSMLRNRSTILASVSALTLTFSPLVLAEEAASNTPGTAQVEQLQTQLAEMQKEMAAMRKMLEGSGDIPAGKRQMMQQHMGQMGMHWQQMHDQCCMMNPTNCPQAGAASDQ
jgi:hypothetical protein